MEKRTVYYIKGNRDIHVGMRAFVTVINDSRFKGLTDVVTGNVIDYDERNGLFETANSLYVPAEHKE